MTIKILVIRREYKLNEYRVPIIPVDCLKLLDNNFKVYWAEPTIVKQGSQNNSFKSSISCDRK
jgi:hypothetical protein